MSLTCHRLHAPFIIKQCSLKPLQGFTNFCLNPHGCIVKTMGGTTQWEFPYRAAMNYILFSRKPTPNRALYSIVYTLNSDIWWLPEFSHFYLLMPKSFQASSTRVWP